MKIYITRHSQTLWNVEKRLQGRKDSPLTKQGYENALALKSYIKDMHFDYVFSSPISRALTTAQTIVEQDIIQDDRLKEMNFGIYEGMKISDIHQLNHSLYDNLWNHPEKFTHIPTGESYDDVILRVRSFLSDINQLPHDSHVLIVTHGMFFIVLLATMLGYEKKDFIQWNRQVVEGCSLTCVSNDKGHMTLEFYNECSFLPHVTHASFQ